ncbi:MAG: hypothetical protein ACD_58C00287G0003 [uncultured bacterium]|nr:MAG: hypothetical protein ACD_58C00287G0003 [uncultured bacterium]
MLEITDAEFQKEVIEADKPVVVDFFASWCAPCQMLMPKMEGFSTKYANVKIVKMSVEKNQTTPAKYSVMSIPTILFFDKGKIVGQITGAEPDSIEKKIKEL